MVWRRRTLAAMAALAAAAAALGGCTGTGNSWNPVGRSLGWFNFLNGTDMRRDCGPGAPERVRFVYNARWGEQVRIYELLPPANPGGPPILGSRVIFPENLLNFRLDDPLAPWAGKRGSIPLSPADVAAIDRALDDSGFDAPAPAGLNLPSDGFYWVVAACRGGQFHFNAWVYPSERFAALRFPEELFRRDRTGVAVRPPDPNAPTRIQAYQGGRNSAAYSGMGPSIFDLEVGENGLKNILSVF
ncbi:MAG TPA: hypothetical protein VGD08_00215 [Stellaceae bacterium]|jgi:hypothetical protein